MPEDRVRKRPGSRPGLFDAEHLTLYAMDYDKREIYSKFLDLDEVKEIRVPLNEQSIVGFVARNRKTVNIADAYNTAALTRNRELSVRQRKPGPFARMRKECPDALSRIETSGIAGFEQVLRLFAVLFQVRASR